MQQLDYAALSEVSGGNSAFFYTGLAISTVTGKYVASTDVPMDDNTSTVITVGVGLGTAISIASGPVTFGRTVLMISLNALMASSGYLITKHINHMA